MGNNCCSFLFEKAVETLKKSIDKNDAEKVKELIANNPKLLNCNNINNTSNTPLLYAIETHRPEICELLLDLGADANLSNPQTKLTPMHCICSQSGFKYVSTPTPINYESPISYEHGSRAEIVKTESNSSANKREYSSELIFKIIKSLHSHGAELNRTIPMQNIDENSQKLVTNMYTPLMVAVENRNLTAIEALVACKVDINFQEAETNRTALHLACLTGNSTIVQKLLECGANAFLKSKDGNSVVHYLAINNKDDSACLLALLRHTENLLDLNLKNNRGQTALMYAAQRNKKNLLKCLLDNNALPEIKDSNGLTAQNYAKRSSCNALLASFNNLKKLSEKKSSSLAQSKLSLSLKDSLNSSSPESEYYSFSTQSLHAVPLSVTKLLATVQEDFPHSSTDEISLRSE